MRKKEIFKMKRLIIPIGCVCAGKTILWDNIKHAKSKNLVRVSRDDIRYQLYDYEKGLKLEFEDVVQQNLWNYFLKAILNDKNIYLDLTNYTRARRMPFVYVARYHKYQIVMIVFNTTLSQSIKRNKLRKRMTSEKIICEQFQNTEYPDKSEYDILHYDVLESEMKLFWDFEDDYRECPNCKSLVKKDMKKCICGWEWKKK